MYLVALARSTSSHRRCLRARPLAQAGRSTSSAGPYRDIERMTLELKRNRMPVGRPPGSVLVLPLTGRRGERPGRSKQASKSARTNSLAGPAGGEEEPERAIDEPSEQATSKLPTCPRPQQPKRRQNQAGLPKPAEIFAGGKSPRAGGDDAQQQQQLQQQQRAHALRAPLLLLAVVLPCFAPASAAPPPSICRDAVGADQGFTSAWLPVSGPALPCPALPCPALPCFALARHSLGCISFHDDDDDDDLLVSFSPLRRHEPTASWARSEKISWSRE
ncbi:uncharacterized protein PSFLO_00778 [Pseudozyma flocculosa]|uniref:Uncharacterized protein n=1 Tax=Pseudozyma flocculosa TaxID=84751 RepID=A0A5C3EV06_9BASI|nr:uncharacterized protein PSFLO_00778 [Pseudozyma flocculosa]